MAGTAKLAVRGWASEGWGEGGHPGLRPFGVHRVPHVAQDDAGAVVAAEPRGAPAPAAIARATAEARAAEAVLRAVALAKLWVAVGRWQGR